MGARRVVGRLAPTPSGDLHLGNVCAFGMAWLSARAQHGRVLLRVEDLDRVRARSAVEERLRRDLDWLGLHWDAETPRQSSRTYDEWFDRLAERTYRCACTRASLAASQGVYPGTCRELRRTQGSLRLRLPATQVAFEDAHYGPQTVDLSRVGDPILRRRDGQVAYMLAVVADDIRDRVTEVVRGADLLEATAVQAVLWEAFGARWPTWCHAPLVLGKEGVKLSKSHGAEHIGALRDAGWTPADVWRVVLPWLGLDPAHANDLSTAARGFVPRQAVRGPIRVLQTGPRPGMAALAPVG